MATLKLLVMLYHTQPVRMWRGLPYNERSYLEFTLLTKSLFLEHKKNYLQINLKKLDKQIEKWSRGFNKPFTKETEWPINTWKVFVLMRNHKIVY